MITKFINFKNFKRNKPSQKTKKNLDDIFSKKSEILSSLTTDYKISKNLKKKYKNIKNIRLIGMGGSILGSKAIYSFLKNNIKKNFYFVDNLYSNCKFDTKKKYLNLIVSKSGNTLETISNVNFFVKKEDNNIFITENKKSYLFSLAQNLKSEIIHHNNYIGGRYSVLSEVGMLPAELMGLNPKKFRQLNNLIKNKFFFNAILSNVDSIVNLYKKKKFNSVILNYDPSLKNFLEWYKQLVGESLGKKGRGIQPIISNVPKDNHSVMQHYLDGSKNNFYSFFFSNDSRSQKIKNSYLDNNFNFLKNKTFNQIIKSQKQATEKVFLSKKIPFRSFEILNKNEKTLGELFIFFIFETILLAKALRVNPYDQPSVELIKSETKKILTK